MSAGDVREPSVLFTAARLDGHLQECRLRQVVDTVSVLLVAVSSSL